MIISIQEAAAHLKLAEEALDKGKTYKALFFASVATSILNRIQEKMGPPDEDDLTPLERDGQ